MLAAEEDPALVEVLEAVAKFAGRKRWRAICESNSLPVAPEIATGAMGKLLEIYKSWPGAAALLRKKYRDAVLRKDDTEALPLARRLLKLDPSDNAARDELNRILRRHFRNELAELDELIDCGDEAAIAELVDRIDRLPFDELKRGSTWEAGVKIRDRRRRAGDEQALETILEQLPEQIAASRLDALADALGEARKLIDRHRFQLTEPQERQLADAKDWAAKERERRSRSAERKEILDRCTSEVSKVEANWSTLLGSPLAEIEGARRRLNNCWKEVERNEAGAGPELGAKLAELCDKLDREIRKRKGRARRKQRAIVGGVSLAAFVTAYVLYAQWRGPRMVEQFGELMTERSAKPLKSLVASTHTYRWPIARLARIDSQIANAQSWLDREYGHYDTVVTGIGKLDTETREGFPRPIEAYYAEIEALDEGIDKAARDLQEDLRRAIAPMRTRWEAHVDAYVARLRQRRAAGLAKVQQILDGAPRLDAAARDDGWFQSASAAADDLREAMHVAIPPAAPLPEVGKQGAQLVPQIDELVRRTNLFREVLAAARGATSFEEYRAALFEFQNGPFAETPEQVAANTILVTGRKKEQMIGEIFAPGQAEGWDHFLANREMPLLFPKTIAEKERVVLEDLGKDPQLDNLHRCVFQRLPSGETFVRYSNGPTERRDRRVGATPILARAGNFFSDGGFSFERYDLKNGKGVKLLSEGLSAETALRDAIMPNEKIMSGGQQYYRTSLLEPLDQILAATNAHVLYRAYLHHELGKVIAMRRAEWGTVFAPRVMADLRRVAESMPGVLRRDDWLWPGRHTKQAQALRQLYSQRRGSSYRREAQLNRQLVEDTMAAGFEFAGYVDSGGGLILRPAAETATELYGWPTDDAPAAQLFHRTGDATREQEVDPLAVADPAPGWQKLAEPTPLTPLIVFKGDRDELLTSAAAAQGMSVAQARSLALPFFRGETAEASAAAEATAPGSEERAAPSAVEDPFGLGLP